MVNSLYRLDYPQLLGMSYPILALETDRINLTVNTLITTLFEALEYSLDPLRFDDSEYLSNCIEDLIEIFDVTSLNLLKAFRHSVYSLINFQKTLPEITKTIKVVHLDESSIYVEVQHLKWYV